MDAPPRFASLLAHLQTLAWGLTVGFKTDSRLMQLLGALLVFNQRFLTAFTTTIGTAVYFPSPEWLVARGDEADEILAHEGVHAFDYRRDPWGFVWGYVFPQVLAVVPMLMALVLLLASPWRLWILLPLSLLLAAFVLAGFTRSRVWPVRALAVLLYAGIVSIPVLGILAHRPLGVLAAVAMVLALPPWPSPGRVKAELRGYGMTLAYRYWKGDDFPSDLMTFVESQFTGPAYYWMSWSGDAITRELSWIRQQIRTNQILDGDENTPYRIVRAEVLSPDAGARG